MTPSIGKLWSKPTLLDFGPSLRTIWQMHPEGIFLLINSSERYIFCKNIVEEQKTIGLHMFWEILWFLTK